MSAVPPLPAGEATRGAAASAGLRAAVSGGSLRTRIVGLAALAAAIPLPFLWLLTAAGARQASRESAAELDALGRQNVRQVAGDVARLCASVNGLMQPRLDRGVVAAREILARLGGLELDGTRRTWSAVDQESRSISPVTLPGVSLGAVPLVENRDPKVRSPLVDEIRETTGMWSSLFQRMNEKGDMLRVVSSILTTDGKRGTGLFLPAVLPDGAPNPVLASVLAGRTYRGTSLVAGKMYLAAYDPVRDRSGRVVGMLAVAFDSQILEGIRRSVAGTVVGRGGWVAVLGTRGASRGVWTVSRGRARDGQSAWEERDAEGRLAVQELVALGGSLRSGDVAFHRSAWPGKGGAGTWRKLSAVAYFEPWDWLIEAGTDESDFLGARTRTEAAFDLILRRAGLGAVAAFLLAAGIALVLAHRLARPLVRLLGETERLGRGDLRGATAPRSLPSRSGDETGLLAHAFGAMAATLASLVRQVQRSGIQVVASSTRIAASARQLEDSVAHQAATTPEVSAAARQISATARQLAETADAVASVASATSARAADGRAALSQMDGSVRRIEGSSSSVSRRLADISDRTRSISSLVTTISRVADQTNLLSLNASIEAEKAGDQGQGFAVVAREVRRLADQTAVATLDIERTVRDVLAAVSSGVAEMDRFVEEVRAAGSDVGRIGSLLSSIAEDVADLAPRLESVRSAAREQAEGAGQISEAMLLLDRSASSSRDTLDEFREATRSLQDAVASLRAEVGRLQVDP